MSSQTFLEQLQELENMPEYIDKDQARHNLTNAWIKKSSVVAEVATNKTSLETILDPLVQENLRLKFPYYNGACQGKQFEQLGEDISNKLGNLLPLSVPYWGAGRGPSTATITAPVSFPWPGIVGAFLPLSLVFSLCSRSFIIGPVVAIVVGLLLAWLIHGTYIQERKELALKTQELAQWLNRVIQEVSDAS